MRYPASAFCYWEHGNSNIAVNPDPPIPEEAKPFIVCARTEHIIPINVLVFARDPEHAQRRVRLALEECAEKDYGKGWGGPNRAISLLKDIDSGKLKVSVDSVDIEVMSRAAWASNDTVCG